MPCMECDRLRHRVLVLTRENSSLGSMVRLVRRVVGDARTEGPGATQVDVREVRRIAFLRAMELSGGNRARAARMLGVARSTLFLLMKRYGYNDDRSRP